MKSESSELKLPLPLPLRLLYGERASRADENDAKVRASNVSVGYVGSQWRQAAPGLVVCHSPKLTCRHCSGCLKKKSNMYIGQIRATRRLRARVFFSCQFRTVQVAVLVGPEGVVVAVVVAVAVATVHVA